MGLSPRCASDKCSTLTAPLSTRGRSHFAPHPHHAVITSRSERPDSGARVAAKPQCKKIEALVWAGRPALRNASDRRVPRRLLRRLRKRPRICRSI
jgi:hypothetical protein